MSKLHVPDTDLARLYQESRRHVARTLERRAATIVDDAVLVFPPAADDRERADATRAQAERLIQLLVVAVRDGEVDPREPRVAALRRAADTQPPAIREIFDLAYLLERSALDELAVDESFGAASRSWPAITRIVRHASFDLLAGLAGRLAQDAGTDALVDSLTTLHTRPVLVAALEKEIQRAERFGHPFALILLDVDRFASLNEQHGDGVGDKVLERLGILLRNYFREQDWVSRCAGDSFAILLPETAHTHARQLAERVRLTVRDRLALPDHKSGHQVPVTVSVALVIATAVDASIHAELLLSDAAQAVRLAGAGGGNRVEEIEIAVKASPASPGRAGEP